MVLRLGTAIGLAVLLGWMISAQPQRTRPRPVTNTEWLSYGGDAAETHFSPLDQINIATVSRLGLAWSTQPGTERGFESTPLEEGGVIYASGGWSVVFAVDARTGALKWRWDPGVSRSYASLTCCGADARGVALYDGKVFAGVIDGRLAALDQATGQPIWVVQTTDPSEAYSITGPPRIVKGKVIIGNAGAEFGVRGYVSAYSPEDGRLLWRFYTVPGDPSKPFEHPELEMAAKTWTGHWWDYGGGGTVWDAMAYDPQADLLYVGTGNGSPWNRDIRSPEGGDNLFLCSVLALDPDTGRMAWYYQTTPGETWDFTSTQSIVLADLRIDGRDRKVLLHAPKNGFFYVLDRLTGEFLSAQPITPVNWATHIDTSGRPVEVPGARYHDAPVLLWAGGGGAHNWHPMSFNPRSGLAYIPGQNQPLGFAQDPNFQFTKGKLNHGVAFPQLPGAPRPDSPRGFLLAWDPIAQRERWRIPYPSGFNGGTLATGGNLVFHGAADGRFFAYNGETGARLWEVQLAASMATPITYALDGRQYVTILAGRDAQARMYTFTLDGTAPLP